VIGAEWLGRIADAGYAGWGAMMVAPFVGSFLGVVVRRLPDGGAVAWGRSRCEECGSVLAARDLVPLVSWLVTRGRCRFCRRPLSWFYPGIELAALVVVLVAIGVDGDDGVWLDCILGWWLLALGWTDLRRWLLPDLLTLPLIIAGLVETAPSAVSSAISACGRSPRSIGRGAVATGSAAATPSCWPHRAPGSVPPRCRR
jgi:hypothetical protein